MRQTPTSCVLFMPLTASYTATVLSTDLQNQSREAQHSQHQAASHLHHNRGDNKREELDSCQKINLNIILMCGKQECGLTFGVFDIKPGPAEAQREALTLHTHTPPVADRGNCCVWSSAVAPAVYGPGRGGKKQKGAFRTRRRD